MSESISLDPTSLAALPIFPLPNCVLLPGGLLPLHVFEPRYRELTRDCLAGNHLMGIARLRPGFPKAALHDPGSRPSIYERFGVGKIICSEELPDGRFALLLRGVARVELEHELGVTGRMYRSVSARLLPDATVDPVDARDHHRRLVALCDRLAELLDQGGSQLRELVRSSELPGQCADAVAALIMDADERQDLLETCCPLQRLQRTLGHVSHLVCELAPCESSVN